MRAIHAAAPHRGNPAPMASMPAPAASQAPGQPCKLRPMALTATIHNFTVQLADVDRGVYQDFELRLARHPSETTEFMLARLLAYCLEWQEGIALSEGV